MGNAPLSKSTIPKERLEEIKQEYPAIQLINHPFRVLVIGKSQSGKTTLGVKVAEWLIPQVDETYVVSPTFEFQPTWAPIRKYVTVAHDGPDAVFTALYKAIKNSMGDEEHKIGTKVETRRLLICDDVSYEKTLNLGNKGIFNGFAYNAVWWNLSILVMVHKTTNIGAGLKENCDALIIFNVVKKEYKALFDTFGIGKNQKEFDTIMHELIKKPILNESNAHPFLFIIMKSGQLYYNLREKILLE